MKVELRNYGRGWYWLIRASNGKTLCHSENYSSKAKAVQTYNRVMKAILCGRLKDLKP